MFSKSVTDLNKVKYMQLVSLLKYYYAVKLVVEILVHDGIWQPALISSTLHTS